MDALVKEKDDGAKDSVLPGQEACWAAKERFCPEASWVVKEMLGPEASWMVKEMVGQGEYLTWSRSCLVPARRCGVTVEREMFGRGKGRLAQGDVAVGSGNKTKEDVRVDLLGWVAGKEDSGEYWIR